MIEMDEEARERIALIESNSRFPTGIGQIERGTCPMDAISPIGCSLCIYGHMLECHYPYTCEEAECNHYLRDVEEE